MVRGGMVTDWLEWGRKCNSFVGIFWEIESERLRMLRGIGWWVWEESVTYLFQK